MIDTLGRQPLGEQAGSVLASLSSGLKELGERAVGRSADDDRVGEVAGAAIGGAALLDPDGATPESILSQLGETAKPDHPRGDTARLETLANALMAFSEASQRLESLRNDPDDADQRREATHWLKNFARAALQLTNAAPTR